MCFLQRDRAVSHNGDSSKENIWSCCLVGVGWGVLCSHTFPLFRDSSFLHLSVNVNAVTHHFHLIFLALFSPFQASKAWRKNKMDESKHEIHSQVDAITAGTASVVNLTAGMWRAGEEECPVSKDTLVSLVWLKVLAPALHQNLE